MATNVMLRVSRSIHVFFFLDSHAGLCPSRYDSHYLRYEKRPLLQAKWDESKSTNFNQSNFLSAIHLPAQILQDYY